MPTFLSKKWEAAAGRRSASSQRGIALILVLGMLALILIVAMSFAFSARLQNSYAKANADFVRANQLAQSTVQRVISIMQRDLGGDFYPRGKFYLSTDSNWQPWPLMASLDYTNSENRGADLDTALNVQVSRNGMTTLNYTPGNNNSDNNLNNNVGFNLVRTFVDTSAAGSGDPSLGHEETIGRIAYLILDETGKLDPGVITDTSRTELQKQSDTRDGDTVAEMSLRTLFSDSSVADGFMRSTLSGGHKPTNADWFSPLHLLRANTAITDDAKAREVLARLFPGTLPDKEQFWVDRDNDGYLASDTEPVRDRLDLSYPDASKTTAQKSAWAKQVYDLLIGYHVTDNPDRDKPEYYSPWLKAIMVQKFAGNWSNAGNRIMARRYAAQMAVNMLDWVDTDSDDTQGTGKYEDAGYVDPTGGMQHALTLNTDYGSGSNQPPTYSGGAESVVYGTEDGPMMAEILVRVMTTSSPWLFGFDLAAAKPRFLVKLYQPFAKSGSPDPGAEVDIQFTLRIEGDFTSANTDTRTVTFSTSAADPGQLINQTSTPGIGGRLYYTTNYLYYGTSSTSTACVITSGESWRLASFNINSIAVYKGTGSSRRRMRLLPTNSEGTTQSRVIGWLNSTNVSVDTDYWVKLTAKDPLFSDCDMQDSPTLATYWTVTPNTCADGQAMESLPYSATPSPTADPSTITTSPATGLGYSAYSYCGLSAPADSAFTRLGQLGQLHSAYAINRSVQLWAAADGEWTGEGRILDLFRIGTGGSRGRLNLNSRNNAVLDTFFTGVGLADPTAARAALLARNGGTGGSPLVYRGDLGRIFAGLSYNATTDEAAAEAQLSRLIELTDVRNEYYTMIAAAEALRDIGAAGSVPNAIALPDGRYAIRRAQQKIIATFYRDAFTREVRRLGYYPVED